MATGITLKGAKIAQGGKYFTEGWYRVRVGDFKIVTRRNNKGRLFVMETEILKSEGDKAQKPGRCNWTVKMELDAAAGNILELMIACSGIDPRDQDAVDSSEHDWDTVLELALSEDKPFFGEELEIEAWDVKDDVTGKTRYTRCKFFPVQKEAA